MEENNSSAMYWHVKVERQILLYKNKKKSHSKDEETKGTRVRKYIFNYHLSNFKK